MKILTFLINFILTPFLLVIFTIMKVILPNKYKELMKKMGIENENDEELKPSEVENP